MLAGVCVNDTATTEIYALALHDALPILAVALEGRIPLLDQLRAERLDDDQALGRGVRGGGAAGQKGLEQRHGKRGAAHPLQDRKRTRLNSSHANISYAGFCLEKKTGPSR